MNWKLKAAIQNLISLLPLNYGNYIYYLIQRHLGNLKCINPVSRFQAAMGIIERIEKNNHSIADKKILEIGTGHQLNLPIALWLCGASEIITVDVNPYLKPMLVFEDIAYIHSNRQEILNIFGHYAEQPVFKERFSKLIAKTNTNFTSLLDTMNVQYWAPADATCLNLDSQSIDYHISFTVLEHISPEILLRILQEGKRVLRKEGFFVHCIDFSDHFSHSDRSISSINFLKFSDSEWCRLAGNDFMFQNRLRIDDFLLLLDKAQLNIVSLEKTIDARAKEDLDRGLVLHESFRGKPSDVNATITAWLVGSSSATPQ
jgi:hypothetical protein